MSNGVEASQSPAYLLASQPPAKATAFGLSRRVGLIIVLALTVLVYADTARYQFTYDDRAQIVENSALRSWAYAPRCFVEHVWQPIYPEERRLYRPLFTLYLLVNYQLFHLNPVGWHLLMIVWHALVTLLAFMLARRLLKDEAAALIAALIFGLHPVHIEAVAWISGVPEPMLALFLLGALLAYLRWRDGAIADNPAATAAVSEARPSKPARWLALSLGLYALALLSKETAIIMPALVFAYEWLFNERSSRRSAAIKRALPFLALVLVYAVVRTAVLKNISYVSWNLPLSVTLMTVPSVLWFYVRLLVWPVGLSAFYDTPYVTHMETTFWLTIFGILVAAALLWLWGRRSKAIAFAAVVLALPILPVLNFSGLVEREIAHDRYLYIPSIAFAIILAVAIRKLGQDQPKVAGLPAWQAVATLALALAGASSTVAQATYWTDDLQLFARGVVIAPNNDIAVTDYANELFNRERTDEAITGFSVVVERNPTYWLAAFNLGSCYLRQGNTEAALVYRARAKEMHNLMNELTGRTAFVQLRLGRFAEAEAIFRRAIAAHPEIPAYEYGLGVVLKEKGDFEGALAVFKASAVGNPDPLPAKSQIAELEARRSQADASAK
ncbi:MAG: tetratricopeptide repeat protein [Blastocatellia bacterium]